MVNKFFSGLALLSLPAVMAGCGGGEAGTTTTTSPSEVRLFSLNAADTLSTRASIRNATARFTTTAETLENDLGANTVSYTGQKTGTVTIKSDASGTLEFTPDILNATTSLTLRDASPAIPSEMSKTLSDGKTTVFLWTFEDDWQSVVDGSAGPDYFTSFGTSTFDNDTKINQRGYGVIGLETRDSVVVNLPSATYRGVLRMDSFLEGRPNDIFQIFGEVAVEVDFATTSASGRIDNMIVGDLAQTSELVLSGGAISGNRLNATLAYDPATCVAGGCGTISSSDFSGVFFGNAGQELGGTAQFGGVSSDGLTYIAVGVFETQK